MGYWFHWVYEAGLFQGTDVLKYKFVKPKCFKLLNKLETEIKVIRELAEKIYSESAELSDQGKGIVF